MRDQVAEWYWIGRCVQMLGTDTVTLYKKQPDGTFIRHVVRGVQWSSKTDVSSVGGKTTFVKHNTVTFFEGTYEGLDLPSFSEEDALFFGVIGDNLADGRISRLLKAHPVSGLVATVNDNSNRRFLKNIKVVLA